MNYITEHLCFTRYIRTHKISTGEIALWYALFSASNSIGLGKPFSVSDASLCNDCKLSKNGLIKAKQNLIEKGLLTSSEYKPGALKVYRLKSMEQLIKSNDFLFLSDSESGTDSGIPESTDGGNHGGTDSGTDSATNSGTYTINKKREKEKQYKTKRNVQYDSSRPLSEDDLLAEKIQLRRMERQRKEGLLDFAPTPQDSYSIFSKSDAPCLQSGQMKSSGNSSPSYT